ncbi:MAG: YtxH domain-containing protein [Thiovulaceae bacterium]|nr:YtxH domain-containing protein [Sulfurimonadaceae bacterium]
MDRNNTIGLVLGAIIGGVATYYAYKHKDDIIDKINELEDNLHFDHHELINDAKEKLDSLTHSVQSTIERFKGHEETNKTDEMASMMEELVALRAELKAFKAAN